MAELHRTETSLDSGFRREAVFHAPVLNSEEARQGVVSGRVLLVLTTSLMLCLMAFAILFATYF